MRQKILTVSCENAVIVFGIELSLSECLSATGRAAIEIRAAGGSAIEAFDHGLSGDSHLVDRTIAVVSLFVLAG